VLGHGDLHRRNVLLPAGVDDVVALDWGFCGPAPLGADLAELVVGPTWFCDLEIADFAAAEEVAFDAFRRGLADAGWHGDERLLRLGYAAHAGLRTGACMPGWAVFMLGPERAASSEILFGRPVADILAAWTELAELTLDLADEAAALAEAVRPA
jgi:hypothetical protein